MCGDTQIPITDLCQAFEKLKQKDEQNEGKTGLDLQFEVWTNINYHNLTTQLKQVANRWSFLSKVLEQVSPKPLEIAKRAALMHPEKNRTNDFLPRK